MTNANTTSPAHSKGPWFYDQVTLDVWDADGETVASVLLQEDADADDEPLTRGNGWLIAAAPELLRLARSAANSFRKRIVCLEDELIDENEDDINADIKDQIGNYEYLLAEHERILKIAEHGNADSDAVEFDRGQHLYERERAGRKRRRSA